MGAGDGGRIWGEGDSGWGAGEVGLQMEDGDVG